MHSLKMVSQQFCCCFFLLPHSHTVCSVSNLCPSYLVFFSSPRAQQLFFQGRMGMGATFLSLKALLRAVKGRLTAICFWVTSSVWLGCLLANVSLGDPGGAANTHLCNTKKCYKHTHACTHTCVHAHAHTLQPRPVLMSLDGNKVPIHPGGSPGSLAPAARDPAGRRLHWLLLPPPRGAGQSGHSLLLLLLYRLSTWQKNTCRISQKTLSSDKLKVCRFMHVWRLFKNKLTFDVKLQIAEMHMKSKYYA